MTIVQQRMRRLAESGLRGRCPPGQLLSDLRSRARGLEDRTFTRLERIFFGLADKTRLKILKLVENEDLCACEIMAALELTQPTVSHHLGILERSGLVASRREGKWVFYKIANPKVEALLTKASGLLQASV